MVYLLALIVLGLFVIGAVLYAGAQLTDNRRNAADRLTEFTGGPKQGQVVDPVAERIAERLAKLAQPETEEDQNILRQKLTQAGYKGRNAPQVFNALRVGAALFLPILVAPMAGFMALPVVAIMALIAVAAGYYIPQIYLNSQIQTRTLKLQRPLPDALDLLVTTVEAGLGLDAAFRRVAGEIESAAPELALEFQLVNHEISAGVPRIEALKHLQQRTGVEEIRSLVNMLTQAERFGTSIARSLRIHSDITRQKRMSKAEEEAAKVSPKLTIVMILCLMPCLFIVLLGPAVVNIMNSALLD